MPYIQCKCLLFNLTGRHQGGYVCRTKASPESICEWLTANGLIYCGIIKAKSCSLLSGWQGSHEAPLYTVQTLQDILALISSFNIRDVFFFTDHVRMMQNSSAENVPDCLNGRGHSAVIGLVTSLQVLLIQWTAVMSCAMTEHHVTLTDVTLRDV